MRHSVTPPAIAAGLLLLATACTDCFLAIRGRVVDCVTMQPLPSATISMHVDAGIHGAHDWPATFTTDDAGGFRIETNGTETCDSPATLRFEKDGFMPAEVSVKGTQNDLQVCMTAAMASF